MHTDLDFQVSDKLNVTDYTETVKYSGNMWFLATAACVDDIFKVYLIFISRDINRVETSPIGIILSNVIPLLKSELLGEYS